MKKNLHTPLLLDIHLSIKYHLYWNELRTKQLIVLTWCMSLTSAITVSVVSTGIFSSNMDFLYTNRSEMLCWRKVPKGPLSGNDVKKSYSPIFVKFICLISNIWRFFTGRRSIIGYTFDGPKKICYTTFQEGYPTVFQFKLSLIFKWNQIVLSVK